MDLARGGLWAYTRARQPMSPAMTDDPLRAELETAAMAAWPALLDQAQMPQSAWYLSPLSLRTAPAMARGTYLANHQDLGAFVYKYQLRPSPAPDFQHQFQMQRQAFDTFDHTPECTLQEPLVIAPEAQAALLAFVPGQAVADAIEDPQIPQAQRLDLLARAGAWLERYHRSSLLEERQFQTRFPLGFHQAQADKIAAGEASFAAPKLYARGVARLAQLAAQYDGAPTLSARQHGDFHMRNLVVDGACLAGLDVSQDHHAPVGYDIVRFLVHYGVVMAGDDPQHIVPPEALEAFFSGYRLVGPDDPSVGFLQYVRLLALLLTVPKARKARTAAKQRMFTQLRPVARQAFRAA